MTDGSKRYECTEAEPWSAPGPPAYHPDAALIRDEEHDGGDCAVYRCPHCHLTFHVELPD